jgi:cytochrome c556
MVRKGLGGRPGIAAIVAAGVALGAAGAAWALDAAGVEQAREAHFKEIGRNFKAVRDELKKPAPDLAVVRAAARQIDELAPQLPTWFPAGSGPQAGIKTEAKAEIWAKPEDFHAKAQDLALRAKAFDGAAAKGDLGAVTQAQAELGQACKACHEEFRHEDH